MDNASDTIHAMAPLDTFDLTTNVLQLVVAFLVAVYSAKIILEEILNIAENLRVSKTMIAIAVLPWTQVRLSAGVHRRNKRNTSLIPRCPGIYGVPHRKHKECRHSQSQHQLPHSGAMYIRARGGLSVLEPNAGF